MEQRIGLIIAATHRVGADLKLVLRRAPTTDQAGQPDLPGP